MMKEENDFDIISLFNKSIATWQQKRILLDILDLQVKIPDPNTCCPTSYTFKSHTQRFIVSNYTP